MPFTSTGIIIHNFMFIRTNVSDLLISIRDIDTRSRNYRKQYTLVAHGYDCILHDKQLKIQCLYYISITI